MRENAKSFKSSLKLGPHTWYQKWIKQLMLQIGLGAQKVCVYALSLASFSGSADIL